MSHKDKPEDRWNNRPPFDRPLKIGDKEQIAVMRAFAVKGSLICLICLKVTPPLSGLVKSGAAYCPDCKGEHKAKARLRNPRKLSGHQRRR